MALAPDQVRGKLYRASKAVTAHSGNDPWRKKDYCGRLHKGVLGPKNKVVSPAGPPLNLA